VIDLPTGASDRSAAEIARDCASKASDLVLERFRALEEGMAIERTVKGRGNFVTETDLACEMAALGILAEEYPGMPVLSEETAAQVDDWQKGWLWVIDPIDGTSNFARGIPTFAFNIALCLDGEPVLGLTLQPVTGTEFFAVRGGGLTVNGIPTRVSAVATMEEALTGFGMGYEYDRAKLMITLLAEMWPGVQMVQNIGSAALGLAYAASGRFDMYVHSNLYPWDMAAGIIQAREAGGIVLDRQGEPVSIYSEGLIAGAPGPVQEFAAATKDRRWR
jgi:fructose-1,6-bisphosphatase/inositol monophosphatase family enzyme